MTHNVARCGGMAPVVFSGGVKGFTNCSRYEADRLSSDAGAVFAAFADGSGFQIHYFIEDRLEVAYYDMITRTWCPMVREWCHDFYGKLVKVDIYTNPD